VAAIAPGARVVIRDEEWMVRRVQHAARGQAITAIGLSELVRNQQATFLTDLDEVTPLRPEDTVLVRDDSPGHRRARLYLEALLRRSPPTDAALTVGHRAAVREAPYQWEPAAMALSQLRPRILMADGVGLGKTIEVGVLLSELVRRGRGQRILVVALKSILPQFQAELWARFTLPLVRLDSVGVQRVQAKIPSNQNPFHHFDRVIVSIDTLKKDAKYRRYLDDCHWDVVVIDECQNVAERGTRRSQRARLARLLARNTDALILTSATPHDGRKQSFASLLRLLEPTAVAADDDCSQAKSLVIRRFQRDVRHEAVGQFIERDLGLLEVEATAAEDEVFALLQGARFRTIGRSRRTDALFRELLLKAWLSSPAACRETVQRRIDKLSRRDADDDDVQHDLDLLRRILAAAEAVAPDQQAKLQRLFRFLDELGYGDGAAGKRVVVFTERVDTLHFLRDQLARRYGLGKTLPHKADDRKWSPAPIATFHGGQPDTEQYALVQDFNNRKGTIRLLLGTDAASEGLNLHHACHHLVHYDVPWSLITLEQRNGRIDRFGQDATPTIRYLLTAPGPEQLKGDLRIIKRLIDKEAEAVKALGDVAWLMNAHSAEAETERIAQAIHDGTAPEEVIRDVDDVEEAGDDFLADLLADDDEEHGVEVHTRDPFTLFPDDLAFARQGFTHLGLDGDAQQLDWFDDLAGFRLRMPDDLQRRYAYLPPELTRGRHHEVKLTADRARVMSAYDRARDTHDGWPDWELWWAQHPVAEWLTDRVLASFRRHEAPLVEVTRGLPPGSTALVFQSTLSNNRSQPVIVDWSAFVRSPDAPALTRHDWVDLAPTLGLCEALPNTGRDLDVPQLPTLLLAAVREVENHLRGRKRTYEEAAVGSLRPRFRRLRSWVAQRKDALRDELTKVRRDVDRRRIEHEMLYVDRVNAARKQWLQDTVRCDAAPYVRLAAVLRRAPEST
jgi:superfamily II DNA or RNA helicase